MTLDLFGLKKKLGTVAILAAIALGVGASGAWAAADVELTGSPVLTGASSPYTYDFGAITFGANAPAALTITVKNTGDAAHTDLGAELDTEKKDNVSVGAGVSNFTLTPAAGLATLAAGAQTTVSIVPKSGLTAGKYEVSVKVSYGSGPATTQLVNVTFVVKPTVTISAQKVKAYEGTAATGATAITYDVTTTGLPGTTPSITLGFRSPLEALPTDVDVSGSATTITIGADGKGTLSLVTSTGTPSGSYPLKLTVSTAAVTANGASVDADLLLDVTATWLITLTADNPTNGSVTAKGTIQGVPNSTITTGVSRVDGGTGVTVTATPTVPANYYVSMIERTGAPLPVYSGTATGDITRTFSNISAATTFTATFTQIQKVTGIAVNTSSPAGTVPILTTTSAGALRGKAYEFLANVTAVPDVSELKNVTWSVDKKSNMSGTKSAETVFSGKFLTIGRNETVDSLTVTVTSVFDPNVKASINIKVDKTTNALGQGPAVSGTVVAEDVTHNSITVKEVLLGAATPATPVPEPEYAISSKSNNEPVGTLNWVDTRKFNDLDAGTVYYIYARSKEDGAHAAGTRSVSAAVRTLNVYDPSVFLKDVPGSVTFNASGAYVTPKRPGLVNAALSGAIDSIFNVRVSDPDGNSVSVVTGNKADSTVSFTLPAGRNRVGNVTVKYQVRGKLPNNAGFWYTTEDVVWTVTIAERELTAANIVVSPIVSVVYNGSDRTTNDADFAGKFSVIDGAATLVEGIDWTFGRSDQYTGLNRKDAGTAFIVINGTGNYKGTKVIKEFTIERAEISTAELDVKGGSKLYDGTAGIDTNTTMGDGATGNTGVYLSAKFTSGVDNTVVEAFKNMRDYTFSGAAYDSDAAGVNRTLTALIRLNTAGAGSTSKNYRFRGGNGDTLTVKAIGLEILQLTATRSNALLKPLHFRDSIPANHYFNGNIRGMAGTPAFKEPIPGKNQGVTLKYSYFYTAGEGTNLYFNKDSLVSNAFTGDSLWAPRDPGKYKVKVRVANGNANIEESNEYVLGDYVIKEALGPTIDQNLSTTPIETREGRTVTLEVKATAQNGGKLRYQWYRYPDAAALTTDSVLLRNDTLPTLSVVAGKENEYLDYRVKITNSFSGANPVQASVSAMSNHATITVGPPPISIAGGFIVINQERVWSYTGAEVKPSGSDVTVYLRTVNTEGGFDTTVLSDSYYELSYSSNVNVGRATLRVTGVRDYDGVLTAYFNIAKKELARNDLTYIASVPYNNGQKLDANVRLVPPKASAGSAIIVTYDGDTTKPVNAGVYSVIANVTGGANFTNGVDIDMGAFTVTKRVPDSTCFNYSIPRHNMVNPPEKYGISFNGIKGTGSGIVRLTYNGLDSSEIVWEARDYIVRAEVEGGDNYEAGSAVLGTYRITTSVASGNRVIPGASVNATAALAPVAAVSARFTAGPSPVSKSGSGKVSFFSANPVVSGSLYIFDAAGNALVKLKAGAGSGKVAEWAVPASAAEGSYAVKGVLVGKNGAREKVSFVFAVTK